MTAHIVFNFARVLLCLIWESILTASRGDGNSSHSPLYGKLFVVIGAGGAGKALAYGAKEKGARVVVVNRTFGELL